MLRQGNRPLPRTSHPKQPYCSSVKQKYLSLCANRADPRPQAGRCPRQHTAESELDLAHCSPELFQRPEKKRNQVSSLLLCRRGWEVKATAYGALTSIKTSNPMPCHCHPSCLNWNSKLISPRFLPWLPHPPLSPFFCFSCCPGRSNPGSAKTWTAFL